MVPFTRSSLAFFTLCRPTYLVQASKRATYSNLYARSSTCLFTAATLSRVVPATGLSYSKSSVTDCAEPSMSNTGFLNAADAAALDAELMSSPGFSLEQLMELAGLAVAEAVYQVLPPRKRILLICGPGNNGGDGLVAARHLQFFGFDCVVVYPKRSSKQHFINLVQQCEDVQVPVMDEMPADLGKFDAIVDAIFGFSFKGQPREPFATALKQMKDAQSTKGIPIISVDVPSGWNVDEGDVDGTGFTPEVLISLTTPKESAKGFQGRHFVGGRFLPPKLAEKYKVQMPPYPGVSQVMEVSAKSSSADPSTGWEAEYAAYLQEKETVVVAEPSSLRNDWAQDYAEFCAEKEARLAAQDKERRQEQSRL